MNDNPIILSQPGNHKCPVNSFKLYMSKLTKIEAFFQQPNPYFKNAKCDKWYKEQAVGIGTIGKFLSEISKIAEISYIYTNHCINGTTASTMKCAGYTLQEIAFIIKHKNLKSLKYYLEQPSLEDKTNFSKSLFNQTTMNNSDSVFDDVPKPPKVPKKFKKRKKPKNQHQL